MKTGCAGGGREVVRDGGSFMASSLIVQHCHNSAIDY